MHSENYKKFLAALLSIFIISPAIIAQDDSSSFHFLFCKYRYCKSIYLERSDFGHAPSIQPGLSASLKNFTIGAWSAFRLSGNGDDEIDLYISKSIGPVTLAVWDYWSYSKTNPSNYLNFNAGTTSHLIEGQILLSGGEKIPFNLLGSYFFYGSDASKSIYLELQYVRPIKNAELKLFTGYQPKGDFYAQKAGFVNLGASYTQPLYTSKNHSADLLLSLISNPQNKTIFLTVGISLYSN